MPTRSRRDRKRSPAPETVATVPQPFKLVFLSILGLTLLAFAMNVILALDDDPNEAVARLIQTCDFAYKAGIGAIFGLVGGKTI